MNLGLHNLFDLVLMTAGYWLLDGLVRRDGLARAIEATGLRPGRHVGTWIALPLLGLAPLWSWEATPGAPSAKLLALGSSAFLAWKASTRDIDPVAGEARWLERSLVVACVAGTWWSPACAVAALVLLTTPFGVWEHHATLPMRVLTAACAFTILAAVLRPEPRWMADASPLLFFAIIIQVSHYVITALAKGWLGPRWDSWHRQNNLHHLAASAYSWGWARFLPWSTWLGVVKTVKRLRLPMQTGVFALEALAPLALLDARLAIGFCLAFSAFHLGVFALSGLLFWDWILTNLLLALAIATAPATVTELVFGVPQTIAAMIFLVAFPLRHKLWRPMPLGWWDTPFTQRVHWRAEGESGAVYGLYADFFCPHERLFGKVNGCYLAPVPVMTYHLGEVWKHELRDALREAGPDASRLDAVRARFGIEPRSPELAQNHVDYLRRLFHELNHGARKHALPRRLRWLKAPGGQYFNWGDLPAYRRQEKIERITLRYREQYFDGEALRTIRDEEILAIPIDASCATAARVEPPTPKEIDDLLLSHAVGKLIDLPDFGEGGFVEADDGRPAVAGNGGAPR